MKQYTLAEAFHLITSATEETDLFYLYLRLIDQGNGFTNREAFDIQKAYHTRLKQIENDV